MLNFIYFFFLSFFLSNLTCCNELIAINYLMITTLFAPDTETTTLMETDYESILGKEENAGYQHFLLFSQCFLFIQ